GASVATHVLEDLVLDRDRFGHPRGDYPHDAAWDEGALVVLAGHPDRGWVSYRREQESFRFGLDGHRIGEPEPASDALPWRDRVVVSPEPQWDFIRYVGPRGLARVKITADGRWTYNGAVVATTWAGDGFVAAYADRPGTSLWTVRIDCSPRPGS
ncbi:MAG: hypothetical protein H6719_00165, partial [Sandaracinaceae bacterium]|nr:hypothetical protein [Sandaracinaceae bacterium]